MKKIKRLVVEHRVAFVATLFLLVMFVSGSIVSATSVARHRAQEAAAGTEQTDAASGESSKDEEDGVKLTDSQREAIDGYGDDAHKLIETLSASVWTSEDGNHTLRFDDDNQYSETVNGDVTTHSYAILRIDKETGQDGSEKDTVVFETDTGTHIVSYQKLTGTANDGSGSVTSVLSSASMFSLPDSPYKRSDVAASVKINGLNSEVEKLLGGNADELGHKMSGWCASHYPTVTEADWDDAAYIDYGKKTVTLGFTLNNESPVNVTVTYHTDSGAFEFNL